MSKEHFWPNSLGPLLSNGKKGSHTHEILSAEAKQELAIQEKVDKTRKCYFKKNSSSLW